MPRLLASFVAVLTLAAAPAFAGIADSPLPVLTPGQKTQLLFSVPGVLHNGDLGTFFACTSTDTSAQQVAVEVFSNGGGAPCNDATTTSLTVQPGATVVFATGYTANEILVDQVMCGVSRGSARILSTSKKLECSAYIADRINSPAAASWSLNVIAKLTQKAAN